MFKKLLASVGIGAARVDTRLSNDSLYPGDILEGEVYIVGGDVEQDIDDIYLKLITRYKRESGDSTVYQECVLVKHCLSAYFTLQPQEKKVIPFSFQLPYETPVTSGRQPVYAITGLDVKSAINPRDRDEIEIAPHPLMQKVLTAVERLGFRLAEVDCEYAPHWGKFPFVQEFEFRPTGKYRSHLDELEVVFQLLSPDKLDVLLQIDKKARGFKGFLDEAFNIDERYARLHITKYDTNLENAIAGLIDRNL